MVNIYWSSIYNQVTKRGSIYGRRLYIPRMDVLNRYSANILYI